MTIYFMGGEMGAFVPSDSTVVEVSSDTTLFNSAFCRCAIYAPYTENYFESPSIGSLTTAWAHFDFAAGSAAYSGAGSRFSWYDGGGTERIRMLVDNAGTISMQYNVGAGWVTAGSQISVTVAGQRQTIDINVVCNTASGSIKLYISGTERINSGTINLSAITALNKIRFTGYTNGVGGTKTYASQVVVANESTIGMRLLTRYPNAAGATSSWTGAYTDIDEIVYEDADFILSGSANQISTFGQTGPAITGYTVRAVGVTARARCGASGPQNLRHAIRVSGTDYFSGSDIALSAGYAATETIWETNPATSAAWVNTAIDAVQPGVKSIA